MSYQRFNKGDRVEKKSVFRKKCAKIASLIYNIYKIGLENFEMHD